MESYTYVKAGQNRWGGSLFGGRGVAATSEMLVLFRQDKRIIIMTERIVFI